jgi:hypothetical protein
MRIHSGDTHGIPHFSSDDASQMRTMRIFIYRKRIRSGIQISIQEIISMETSS